MSKFAAWAINCPSYGSERGVFAHVVNCLNRAACAASLLLALFFAGFLARRWRLGLLLRFNNLTDSQNLAGYLFAYLVLNAYNEPFYTLLFIWEAF